MTTPRVTVPVEPTEAMIDAYFDLCRRHGFLAHINATAAWRAMLLAAPALEGGAAPFDRDALIALIMEETTDDIVADGWDRLGKPNVLVQGCRYIRRNAPPSPEGYANPEASAKQFAGFIADRVLKALATREEAPVSKNDYTPPKTIIEEAPAEAGEDAEAIVRRWANWIIDESSDMDHDDHDAGKRKVRTERDLILSALRAQPQAREDAQPCPYDVEHKLAEVEGFGASYSREQGSWRLYSMPDAKPFGSIDGFDRASIDFVIDALRSHLRAQDAQPVAWLVGDGDGTIMTRAAAWAAAKRGQGVSVTPLYTHPAPDALRVAVEALEPFAAHPDFHAGDDWPVTFVNDEERVPGVTAGDFRRAARALAALQAEQKGGA